MGSWCMRIWREGWWWVGGGDSSVESGGVWGRLLCESGFVWLDWENVLTYGDWVGRGRLVLNRF